jgi:hypothetical protein
MVKEEQSQEELTYLHAQLYRQRLQPIQASLIPLIPDPAHQSQLDVLFGSIHWVEIEERLQRIQLFGVFLFRSEQSACHLCYRHADYAATSCAHAAVQRCSP